MVELEKRITAFEKLGAYLRQFKTEERFHPTSKLHNLINESHHFNPWFTPDFVRMALVNIGESLGKNSLNRWAERYQTLVNDQRNSKRVGVVMAGNIPLVGFHDFLTVLIAGHQVHAKLSSDDDKLLPAIAELLFEFEPGFSDQFEFTFGKLGNIDAIIATGSNNTSRYFEYYFRNIPHIIRKNRNGVAVLSGNESDEELGMLGEDIFIYFGLGCRSISKLFVPTGYPFDRFFQQLESFRWVSDHNKYRNNYEYYRSIYLINGEKHLDNGFLILKDDIGFSSPPSVLYFEEYENNETMNSRLSGANEQIQCVVGNSVEIPGLVSFGKAQKPALWDYADGVDTLEFLLNL
jgi:hypothetical protein